MKKAFYFIILSILLVIPTEVFAANDVNINCNKTKLSKNEETTCTILVNNLNFTATDITGKIQTGSNLSIVGSSYDSGVWLSLATNFTVADIDLMRNEVTPVNSLTVATFKVKASAAASGISTITFNNVAMGNDSYDSIPISSKTINIAFNSNINTLDALSVTGGSINFSSNETNYSLTIDAPTVTINATPTHAGASVAGTGAKSLNYGVNTLNVVVTAEDGTPKIYTLNITRPDNRSKNNDLKSLSLSKGALNFNKTTTAYNVEVASDVDKLTINAEVADSKSSFENNFGPREVPLEYGNNKLQIKVKAENGSVKTYTINVYRKDDRSSNNNLKNITLSNGKINFDEKTTEYTVTVPNDVEMIKVTAIQADLKSKVEIVGNETIIVGENIFIIKVTAENGEVKEYKIKVIRDEKVTITNSNKLKNIIVEGYKLEFDSEKYTYNLKTNEKKLNIKVELMDEESTYKISGNENLKDGSIISIVVTDEEGNNGIYKIIIEAESEEKEPEKEKKSGNIILYISLVLNIILIVIIIILIIKRNKKKKIDNEFKDDNSENVPEKQATIIASIIKEKQVQEQPPEIDEEITPENIMTEQSKIITSVSSEETVNEVNKHKSEVVDSKKTSKQDENTNDIPVIIS